MAAGPPPFVDLHLHAEGVSDADLTTLSWFGLRAAVTCAHDAGASSAEELRRHWDELVNVQARRLQRAGIRPWVALAVHPARIPWHGVDDLLHRVPRRLLGVLRESRVEPTRVLVDHVTEDTFQLVRACGYFAGLTLQPGLLEPASAAQLLARNGAERVVLTSDIGEGATDLLALPRAADALRKAGLSEALARRALYEGPLSFLGAAPE